MKILVIRFRRVGDAVLSMALTHSLRLSFPGSEIHFIVNSGIAPLFEGHPDLDRVIPFSDADNHGLRYLKKVWRLVRGERYDVIIDMRSTLKTSLFSLFSPGSKYRIGRRKSYTLGLHNFRIPLDRAKSRVESNLDLMAPLRAEGPLVLDRSFPLHVTDGERDAYAGYLRSRGVDLSRPLVLCAVTTRIPGKAWRADRMAEVLRRFIAAHPEAQLVFNYAGEAEAEDARRLHALLGGDAHVRLDVEARNLRELCCLSRQAALFFGNEGGPRHIAHSLGTPTVAIYPPYVDRREWLPDAGDSHVGLTAPTMDAIRADDVFEALDRAYRRVMRREG